MSTLDDFFGPMDDFDQVSEETKRENREWEETPEGQQYLREEEEKRQAENDRYERMIFEDDHES